MPSEKLESPRSAQVWCDVGGTFTDCFVVDDRGRMGRIKFLSHGRVPGRVQRWVSSSELVDPQRAMDPNGFWEGATLVGFDVEGRAIGSAICIGSNPETGALTLDVSFENHASMTAYELRPGIEAPVLGARWLLGVPLTKPLPPLQIRLGTTRGTNALLTRTGAKTVFAVTEGFADLLEIGYQERPDLFALEVRKRPPLYDCVVSIRERLDADGAILRPIDNEDSRRKLQARFNEGYRSLAICLIHAYRNGEHERILAEMAESIGFTCVCVSSQVAPMIKAVSRGETTVVDAYLTPVVQDYLHRVQTQFGSEPGTRLRVMTSSGGLVDASLVCGRETVLSGPAGGAVALQSMARHYGTPKLIGLDMGGTSTDVCRVDGRLQLEHETIKAGVRMLIPTLAIHTVASGGGSVCWFDGVQLRVGPQSAGSEPGPACYGRGGPLTITDLNVLQGRIDPRRFQIPLDRSAAQLRANELLDQVRTSEIFQTMDVAELIAGLRRLANEQMASAVRAITIQQGADPREHALAGFGGAAGQHICEIAELLGMDRILDHPDAGLLSALGMGLAQTKRSGSLPMLRSWSAIDWRELDRLRAMLHDQAVEALALEDVAIDPMQSRCELAMRYAGTEGGLRVVWGDQDPQELVQIFEALHRDRFGYARPGRELELVEIWVEAASPDVPFGSLASASLHPSNPRSACAGVDHALFSSGRWIQIASLDRASLHVGQSLAGPMLINSHGSTTLIDAGWTGRVLDDLALMIERDEQVSAPNLDRSSGAQKGIDPVLREVLAQRVAAIADQMGIALEQTAMSVNVKQRRDFSCAVFNVDGELVANAPHVPVHLGAMGQTVQVIMREFPDMRLGDCFVTNDPYRGGSHLPDVTVVTPVFVSKTADGEPVLETPQFYVASRAHHAEIGGIAPGSMAPTSTRLGEEGVILPPMRLSDSGIDRSFEVERMLREAPFPSRSVFENMADLAAQQAANQRGVVLMRELAVQLGCATMHRYLESILEAAQLKTQRWIETLEDRDYTRVDHMDDGSRIQVCLRKQAAASGARLQVDFSGTGPVSAGNLNANPGIVKAAVLYCVRCAIADTMPLNAGVLRAIDLFIPEGILNPKGIGPQSDWPAVAGGNVETSQRVVDCVLGALGLAAASQGTMNNFLFGNAGFGYYETIGGGTGACPSARGEHAVHSHMTNTRLTDVEVLESRYPVRLIEFSVRRGSGGAGQYPGGDGMVRHVQALEPLEVSLVTSRRGSYPPFGLSGGQSGALGENFWVGRDGTERQLPGSCQLRLEAGEGILIRTPGGGGYGQETGLRRYTAPDGHRT